MPLQATSGAASYDAFGGGVPVVPNYIEEVFSTWVYDGNGSTQTITNGIDLSTKGGLVWIKSRSTATDHALVDTVRGSSQVLHSEKTDAQVTAAGITSFNSNGFGLNNVSGWFNNSGRTYVSWTFREQPKFFDVVTYTGNGTSGRTVAHNLGSVPGCMIVKKTSGADSWAVYHRSAAKSGYTAKESYLILNSTQQVEGPYSGYWNNTDPTDTVFTLGNDGWVNANGATYVAYLFAHDAGGFGLTGTDNVISCGSYTGNGSISGPTVNLGYEPQWVMIKNATDTTNWAMFDNMRGIATGGTEQRLYANTSGAEVTTSGNDIDLTATGFDIKTDLGYLNTSGSTFIYIAIRRGPMKVPTSGTSVFAPVAVASSTSNGTQIANSFVTDMAIGTWRDGVVEKGVNDRLRGISTTNPSGSGNPLLKTNTTGAETTPSNIIFQGNGNATMLGQYFAGQGYNQIYWLFGRAPSFFDEVCFSGTGAVQNVSHNLAAVPELMILKQRNGVVNWMVYHSALGNTKAIYLDSTSAASSASAGFWNNTSPTSSVFTVSMVFDINASGSTSVAYLFATCAGVSKVTTFTGNGSSQTIDCGFTGGARFVLIKRTDSTGNWVTFDTARGISSGNDPALYLNSTAAEVTGVDAIDPDSTGFIVNQESTFNLNVSSATYLVLAIA